ncbi:MAG: prolipoprotein diacylglyceryl transferase [bacterium]
MIPYFEFTSIQAGPLTLYVWGFFVALGFVAGSLAAGWMARRRNLKIVAVYDLAAIAMLAGLVGGRLAHILLYDPGYYLGNPSEILMIWHGGLSVYGGFIAVVIAGAIYLRRKKLSVWDYADTAVFGLPVGLWIGRIGCFLIHDHPGTQTSFPLGIEFPDGIIRHDHGLYLSINGLAMAITFLLLARKQRQTGLYIAIFALWYGIVRFGLDFLRAFDVRYLGLTPAQYLSILLAAFGIITIYKLKNRK